MGMFDNVRCKYPLPWPEVQEAVWQSKCTPAQSLDQYEIREDGTLWHCDEKRWEQVDFTGELEIHEYINPPGQPTIYYGVRFWFRDGVVKDAVFSKNAEET